MSRQYKIKCDQCEPMAINSKPCHEQGCVNSRTPWFYDDETSEVRPQRDFDVIYDEYLDDFDLMNEVNGAGL